MIEFLSGFVADLGVSGSWVGFLVQLVVIICVVVASFAANWVIKRIIISAIRVVVSKSKTEWDDIFLKKGVFTRLSHIAPALIIYASAYLIFPANVMLRSVTERVSVAYMILIGALVASSVLSALTEIGQNVRVLRDKPIQSFSQAVKVLVFVVAGILMLTSIVDRSPWAFLSGLGAMTAVILLVFREPILGLVASIQLSGLNLVRPGDWIEMPKYGADGDVIDVSLTTVKVQNWDKTITSIPAYALISDSFKNWRGMSESGGRRIKRSINIDMSTVTFCTPEMVETFRKIQCLREYIDRKENELAEYNETQKIDGSQIVNGRRMTNLGTFRAYIQAYLRQHPKVHQGLTFLVRHLQPTENGLPIEIYVFSNDQVWANYEGIQADIFDHLLAAVPEFDLRVFQNPSGRDLQRAFSENVPG